MEHYYRGTSSMIVFFTPFIVTVAQQRIGLYRLWSSSRHAHRYSTVWRIIPTSTAHTVGLYKEKELSRQRRLTTHTTK